MQIRIEDRPNLSEPVANGLRDRIYDGRLKGGERINEVHLARDLGVSRTCVREALSRLVAEEALVAVPRRGCFVRELTRKEFDDIYPIRALLDPEALRLAGVPSLESFERLEGLEEQKRAATDPAARITLDEAWHLELLSACENEVLMSLIVHFMRRFRRYGLAFGGDLAVMETAQEEHGQILRALQRGDVDEACHWLRRNLTSPKEPILQWLDERARDARQEVA
ncbi:MAG: GntR family transcriptional regulator [Gemmatimonadota bacterium]